MTNGLRRGNSEARRAGLLGRGGGGGGEGGSGGMPPTQKILKDRFEARWVINAYNYRYAHDTFTMFDNKDQAYDFLRYFNGRHNNKTMRFHF